ncbi:MAG: hypothetical protein PHQ40_16340 [Anaerolineaceae bacterium]|nr:hypothetical protein [Anaerolineaceae bacterium]
MGKQKCRMTLKDLLEYLNSLQVIPATNLPSSSIKLDERVFIRGEGIYTLVLDIEAMEQIVRANRMKAVCAN